MIERDSLVGIWHLLSAKAFDAGGAEIRPPYGPEPMGQLVLNQRGRMMAVLCDGRVEIPVGERRAYASYCGNYRLEGDYLVTRVDAALETDRIGGEQIRKVEMRNGNLVLIPPQRGDGEQRELIWGKVGQAMA